MPPTDSIEKPPTVELTAGPIAVFSNSYARLPAHFFARLAPTPVPKPRLIKLNESLASELGVDAQNLEADELAAVFAGNVIPLGAEPIALAYAGHQFGHFVPQLGDGRAILLGEVLDRSGERRDVQLKGAGRTPFSRRGDGRAALGPVLREYLVSEAMHALGIPTTRALAAVSTGEPVYRDRQLPGAVLTRVASSHIRVGQPSSISRRAATCRKPSNVFPTTSLIATSRRARCRGGPGSWRCYQAVVERQGPVDRALDAGSVSSMA